MLNKFRNISYAFPDFADKFLTRGNNIEDDNLSFSQLFPVVNKETKFPQMHNVNRAVQSLAGHYPQRGRKRRRLDRSEPMSGCTHFSFP